MSLRARLRPEPVTPTLALLSLITELEANAAARERQRIVAIARACPFLTLEGLIAAITAGPGASGGGVPGVGTPDPAATAALRSTAVPRTG